MKRLLALLVLTTGCANQETTSIESRANSARSCQLSNYLDRDSFNVAADGFRNCLANAEQSNCEVRANSIEVRDLDEGVGSIRAVYRTNRDGSHDLRVYGRPTVGEGPANTILTATHLPASTSLATALKDIYFEEERAAPSSIAACEWN